MTTVLLVTVDQNVDHGMSISEINEIMKFVLVKGTMSKHVLNTYLLMQKLKHNYTINKLVSHH